MYVLALEFCCKLETLQQKLPRLGSFSTTIRVLYLDLTSSLKGYMYTSLHSNNAKDGCFSLRKAIASPSPTRYKFCVLSFFDSHAGAVSSYSDGEHFHEVGSIWQVYKHAKR